VVIGRVQTRDYSYNLQEMGGAVADLGTLLPLMLALILLNGLSATVVLILTGLVYIVGGIYYRIPMPVQPLKAVAAISITLGLSSSVIGAAGIIMGVVLLLLSVTNLSGWLTRIFPRAVVRGIQLSIGVTLAWKGLELVVSRDTFIIGAPRYAALEQLPLGIILAVAAVAVFLAFKYLIPKSARRFPASLALVIFGFGCGIAFGPLPALQSASPETLGLMVDTSGFGSNIDFGPLPSLPTAAEFWIALTVLVIPQLPLTLGNAVVGTCDTSRLYFGDGASRVRPRALTTSMGIANILAGCFGGMPICHGSGGLTAHYKLGARTGGAAIMIGGLLLALGIIFGYRAPAFLSLIPLAVLGVLLVIVGLYHALLVRDIRLKSDIVVVLVVLAATFALGNLAYGFGAGLLVYFVLKNVPKRVSQLRNT
jgi:SulP family sulfate permease